MSGPDDLELLLDDLVQQVVEEAMAEVAQDASTQDLRAVLAKLRDVSRRRIQDAVDAMPVDELRLLFCVMVDRSVKAKVQELIQAASPQPYT